MLTAIISLSFHSMTAIGDKYRNDEDNAQARRKAVHFARHLILPVKGTF